MGNRLFTVGPLVPNQIVHAKAQAPTEGIEVKAATHTAKKDNLQKIVVSQDGKRYEIQPAKGQLLLDAALQQGQALNYKCRKGTCGACKVKVDEGAMKLLPPNEQEQTKLKDSLREGYRLACQSVMV
ncbi:MAG: 2Fe-2S iron-sulfur cluster-binding protein [Ectobacillus sp.]